MGRWPERESENRISHKYVLDNFLDAYLVQRNPEKTFSLVTDDIYSLGTGKQELAFGKEEFQRLIYDELEQIPTSISYCIDDYKEKMVLPDILVCFCEVTTCLQMEGIDIHYQTRLTAGFRKVKDEFLAYHLHMSEASSTQHDFEFFPLHYGQAEQDRINAEKQIGLVELMKKMLPGGAMGGYLEPGFPLYFVNDELLSMLGYTYDEFIEENGQMMSNTMHPDDIAMVDSVIRESFENGNEYSVEYRMKKKDHSYIWVRDIGRKTIASDGRLAMISIIADITDEKTRQQSFVETIESMKKERRRIDRMTQLLNREPAEILIEQHLIREQLGAFFLLDIDNFKLVNDLKGHPAGDQVLYTFAEKLKKIFPSSAVIARWGGDEFVAFLPQYKDVSELEELADKMIDESEDLVDDSLLARKLGVSIGIAIAPEHGRDIKELYANADKGLYLSKRSVRSCYNIFKQSSALANEEEITPNILTLRRMIQSVLTDKGAFKVEYDTFSSICQFALRNSERLKQTTQIILFSLRSKNAKVLNDEQMKEHKKSLEQVIKFGLRTGDLLMDFSSNQFAVMLVNCSDQNALLVAERVVSSYMKNVAIPNVTVSYECSKLRYENFE